MTYEKLLRQSNDSRNAYRIDIFREGSPMAHYHLLAICPQLVDMNFLFRSVIGICFFCPFFTGFLGLSLRVDDRNLIRRRRRKFSLSRFAQCRIIVKRTTRRASSKSNNKWTKFFNRGARSLNGVTRCLRRKSIRIRSWGDIRNINGWSFLCVPLKCVTRSRTLPQILPRQDEKKNIKTT